MSDASLIAVRYVCALFDIASGNKQHDNVKKDMLALKVILSKSAELRNFLVNPVISRKQAGKAVEAVLAAIKASDLTRRFFSLLAAQRRLALTPVVIEKYLAELAKSRGELEVHVTSAAALGKKQADLLSDALERTTKKKVELKLSENPELLGGVQIRIGSKMLDNSVKNKLARLRQALSRAA